MAFEASKLLAGKKIYYLYMISLFLTNMLILFIEMSISPGNR